MKNNHSHLIDKLLKFWNENDEKEITSEDLKKEFNHIELAIILYDSQFYSSYYNIVAEFRNKTNKLDNLFTEKEALEAINLIQYPDSLLQYLSDEKKLSFLSLNDYLISLRVMNDLTTDEARIKFFNTIEDEDLKKDVICNLESDDLKLKYLKKIPLQDRAMIIKTFKEEKDREKFINFFTANKGEIIASLNTDEKKIWYFTKYFRVLNDEDKYFIITSFKDKKNIKKFTHMCNDDVKASIASDFINDQELVVEILDSIKDPKEIAYFLSMKFSKLSDEFIINYVKKISDENKIELINNIHDGTVRFKIFEYIDNKELIYELIEHTDSFPEYKDKYDYIIDLYVNKYNLNKKQLLYLVHNISFSILKVIENKNIQNIINSSSESFEFIKKIFDKESLNMNSSAMNDTLNTLLQRIYRINNPEIIFIFPYMLNLIENKDRVLLTYKINEIAKKVNIKENLEKKDWSLYQFIELLMNKDEVAIEILHELTNKYIVKLRNQFTQENLFLAIEECSITRYDNNELMKYMINKYPIDLNLCYFRYYKDIITNTNLTIEEQKLVDNIDLIREIILYKKNPQSYEQIPQNVKKNLKTFSSLFEKIVATQSCDSFPEVTLNKKKCEFKKSDPEFLLNILMNLSIERLEKNLFKEKTVLEKFLKIWNQYKIGCWGNSFEKNLVDAGIVINPEIIANFIQYFSLSYEVLEEKIKKGEISNVSLTALLDLSNCYSSESQVYSILFGNDDFKYIASNPGPNSATMLKEKRLEEELKYLKIIRKRKYVTIPAVDENYQLKNGKEMNIVVGNFSNMMNLTYGERTGSCMRVGGAGRSLFDFCLKNESGFHIRFSNPTTQKFVSRVSGFRNGNTVFLNELRYSEDHNYTNKDVIESCEYISNRLIELTKDTLYPIENVVITPYYAMQESGKKSQNLGNIDSQTGMKKFYIDVSSSSIVLASSAENNELITPKLGISNLPKYNVVRDKRKVLYNKDSQEYIKHLIVLDQFLSGKSIDKLVVENYDNVNVCLGGEDWFVSLDKDGNIEKYIMSNTNNYEEATKEVDIALNYLKENITKELNISNNMSFGM